MIRLRGVERERGDGWIGAEQCTRREQEEEEEGGECEPGTAQQPAHSRQVTDGVCFSQACTCAGGRFSWVLHKGAMGLPGTDAASRTHKLSWNYPGAEKYGHSSIAYSGQAHYTRPAPETERRRREGWEVCRERGKERERQAHGRRKCRLILLHILPQLKLHLSKSVDFSLI